MPKLIVKDNLGVSTPKAYPIESGKTAHEAIASQFNRLNPHENTIYINDRKLVGADIRELSTKLKDGDSVTVVQEVKGTISQLPGMSFIDPLLSIADDFVGDLFNSLIDIPEYDTEKASPNNSFTGQTNIVRAFSQKPLMCGSPVAYPDLIGQGLEYYVGNQKYIEYYMYLCFGEYDDTGADVQAGNTPVLRFPDAEFEFYKPVSGVTTVPNYRFGQEVEEVDGQILNGTNNGEIGDTYFISGDVDSYPVEGGTITLILDRAIPGGDVDDLKAAFDAGVTNFKVTYEYDDGDSILRETDGAGTMTSMVLAGDGLSYTATISGFSGPKSSVDTYGDVTLIQEIQGVVIGPLINPTQCAKMFFNLRWDRGLKATVPIKVVVYELDSKGGTRTGVSETFTVSYTQDTLDEQYRTFEINIANGVSWYEFTIERTNQSTDDTQEPDITKLEKAFCVTDFGTIEFNNATVMRVEMTSTQTPTSSGVDNKINVSGGAVKMPSYDKSTGAILPDAASRNFADAVLFVWRDFYQKDPALLNLDELYTIADSLPDELKTFDYTFDDTANGLGTNIDTILNVARVQRYWDGEQMRFWRDEATDINSTILSRRDMVSESDRSYSITRTSYVTGEFDSVQVEYVDRSINKKAYVYRSIDNSGNIVDIAGENSKSIELIGCQSLDNAINRAELEIRKMLYQRWSLTDTFTDAHVFLDKGAVVLYNEVYEGGEAWGGEILEINGGTATVKEELALRSGTSYYAYYTDITGNLVGPLTVSASTENSFTVSDLSQAYVSGNDGIQVGSRYYITQVNDSINRRWRVVNREPSGMNVQLGLIGYDERVYEYDTM